MKANRWSMSLLMLLGVALGILVGNVSPSLSESLTPLSTAFSRAITMIVIPLVFTAAVRATYSLAKNRKEFGRLSCASALYFVAGTTLSSLVAVLLNYVFRPGLNASLAAAAPSHTASTVDWVQIVLAAIPQNIIASMSSGTILPVLVFGGLLGAGLAGAGESGQQAARVFDGLMGAILKVTGWIITLSPIAIFAITARLVATHGLAEFASLGKFLGVVYLGLSILVLAFAVILLSIGEKPLALFRAVSEPVLLAFTTRSSEVTLPLHMRKLIEFGVPEPIAAIVLPLGYAFNRDGSVMYVALAAGFLADAYHVPLTLSMSCTIVLLSILAIDGCANVPSGGLVAISILLVALGIPTAGLAILVGLDAFFDMGRTALNVLSNTVAVKVAMRVAADNPDNQELTEVQQGSLEATSI